MIRSIFNCWIPFPKYFPKKPGEYLCSIHQPITISKDRIIYHDHIIVLYFDGHIWVNLERKDMLHRYALLDEFGNRVYYDNSIHPRNVVAFKKLPRHYMKKTKKRSRA